LPRVARVPVSSDLAKPRNPPTPVRPVGLAAWAGREAEPSVRLLGLSTGEELADEDGKMRDVETFGAGRNATSRTATITTTRPVAPRVGQGTLRAPAMDCHMDTRPQRPQATQATTYNPRVRSTDWAAATAIRAAEPASE